MFEQVKERRTVDSWFVGPGMPEPEEAERYLLALIALLRHQRAQVERVRFEGWSEEKRPAPLAPWAPLLPSDQGDMFVSYLRPRMIQPDLFVTYEDGKQEWISLKVRRFISTREPAAPGGETGLCGSQWEEYHKVQKVSGVPVRLLFAQQKDRLVLGGLLSELDGRLVSFGEEKRIHASHRTLFVPCYLLSTQRVNFSDLQRFVGKVVAP